MTTMNPFDLLGDNDIDDPSQLIESATLQAAISKKSAQQQAKAPPANGANLPTKPLPPAQAVREARNEGGRGGGRGGGGRGRGGGYNREREFSSNENSFGNSGGHVAQRDAGEGRSNYGGPRGPYRGGRRGGYEEGRDGERPRRTFERHSGTGHGLFKYPFSSNKTIELS